MKMIICDIYLKFCQDNYDSKNKPFLRKRCEMQFWISNRETFLGYEYREFRCYSVPLLWVNTYGLFKRYRLIRLTNCYYISIVYGELHGEQRYHNLALIFTIEYRVRLLCIQCLYHRRGSRNLSPQTHFLHSLSEVYYHIYLFCGGL